MVYQSRGVFWAISPALLQKAVLREGPLRPVARHAQRAACPGPARGRANPHGSSLLPFPKNTLRNSHADGG